MAHQWWSSGLRRPVRAWSVKRRPELPRRSARLSPPGLRSGRAVLEQAFRARCSFEKAFQIVRAARVAVDQDQILHRCPPGIDFFRIVTPVRRNRSAQLRTSSDDESTSTAVQRTSNRPRHTQPCAPWPPALAFGESPRWHDGRLWVSDWGAPSRSFAIDAEGNREVMVRMPTFPV